MFFVFSGGGRSEGVLLSMIAAESRLEPASSRVLEQRARFTNGRGLVQAASWRLTWPTAAKATASVAVVGKTPSTPRAVDTLCWWAEIGMCHADLWREAAAMTSSQARAGAVAGCCVVGYVGVGVFFVVAG